MPAICLPAAAWAQLVGIGNVVLRMLGINRQAHTQDQYYTSEELQLIVEESEEGSGSAAYVPPEPKDDVQLNYALDLLRGVKTDPAFPPNPDKAVMNQ